MRSGENALPVRQNVPPVGLALFLLIFSSTDSLMMNSHSQPAAAMSFDEFCKSWRQMRSNSRNPALVAFNQQDDECKFCVLTLANREKPGSFRLQEVGQNFETFDEARRALIIAAMNKMVRWGRRWPRAFSDADRYLSE